MPHYNKMRATRNSFEQNVDWEIIEIMPFTCFFVTLTCLMCHLLDVYVYVYIYIHRLFGIISVRWINGGARSQSLNQHSIHKVFRVHILWMAVDVLQIKMIVIVIVIRCALHKHFLARQFNRAQVIVLHHLCNRRAFTFVPFAMEMELKMCRHRISICLLWLFTFCCCTHSKSVSNWYHLNKFVSKSNVPLRSA